MPAAKTAHALLGNYVEFRYGDLCDRWKALKWLSDREPLFMYVPEFIGFCMCAYQFSLKHAIFFL